MLNGAMPGGSCQLSYSGAEAERLHIQAQTWATQGTQGVEFQTSLGFETQTGRTEGQKGGMGEAFTVDDTEDFNFLL